MEKFLMYKDRPLVKSQDTIYYGFVDEGVVVMFKIIDTINESGEDLPNNISVTLIKTSNDFSAISIVKNAEKKGLYNALELADIWINTELTTKS